MMDGMFASPDSACRSLNREWFIYKQFYFSLKLKFYGKARRTSSDPIFANCVNCYIGKDILELGGVKTPASPGAHTAFNPTTTCNYACDGGVYDPYDKDNVSLYIEYGNPLTSPTSAPTGYSNCQFFSMYDVKAGSNNTCRFFNVWVCRYDSVENFTISYPSACPDHPSAHLYQNKLRRYPEYVNADEFIKAVLWQEIHNKILILLLIYQWRNVVAIVKPRPIFGYHN